MIITETLMNNEMIASIPADHPLRKSAWIWPEGYMYLLNHFAQFRYDFELKKIPGKAPFFITADKGKFSATSIGNLL
jgi:hypothetical protein